MVDKEKNYEYNLGNYAPIYRNIIIDLLEEHKIDYQEQWHSKYNHHLLMDYEPFCTDGFYYTINLNGNPDVINFIDYLIKHRIGDIEKLDELLLKELKEDN